MTAKTILMQLNHKIATFEHVGKRLVLVLQDCLLDYMRRALAFQHIQGVRNGDAMLFLREHLKIKAERDVSTAATYFSWLADELGKDNLSLLVALVPEKITVYRPLLLEGASAAAAEKGYLDRVEEVLREQAIPVVNLAPVFRREAQIKFQRGEYIYHLDDTHWNARGISIAANEILAVWNRRIAAAQAR